MIAHQNVHVLQQGLDLLARCGDLYAQPGPQGQSSAGAHMRHVLDCYHCFLRGVEAESGKVDYDARERDPEVETDAAHAAEVIRDVIRRLESLEADDLERPLRVSVDAAAWKEGESLATPSSVARELQFLLSHTVHHYALISMILRLAGFEVDPDFGVAPSTLEHRQALEEEASARRASV